MRSSGAGPGAWPILGNSQINISFIVFGERIAVSTTSRGRDFFPMRAAIRAPRDSLAASRHDHPGDFFGRQNLVNIRVRQTIVGTVPSFTFVVAGQYAADFNTGVKPPVDLLFLGQDTGTRSEVRIGWKTSAQGTLTNALEFLPTAAVGHHKERRRHRAHHEFAR